MDKEKLRAYRHHYYETHKEQIRERNKKYKRDKEKDRVYRTLHKEHRLELQRTSRAGNKVAYKQDYRKRNLMEKVKALSHYSSDGKIKCARCGFDDIRALSIDHVNGQGSKHRKEVGYHTYRWLKANDYPSGFQILCMNCQFIKRAEKQECDRRNKGGGGQEP
jgi:hypothetical protein